MFYPMQHLAIACHWSQRAAVLGDVIQVYSGSHGRTIVFCETKKEANELSLNTSIKQVNSVQLMGAYCFTITMILLLELAVGEETTFFLMPVEQ